MGKVLLIGNDINNATSSYSWNDLLDSLVEAAGLIDPLNTDDKPFPLLYEEIYLRAAKQRKFKEIELKKFIAENTKHLEPNVIHERIVNMDVENLLTTNYDLTLEKCLTKSLSTITNKGVVKEVFYNLFRVHEFGQNHIWHIHGSELSPASITLGYEHYSGYLQQMRNYVASGTKGTYKNINYQALIKRLESGQIDHSSWVDFFFTHDVHILGLNMDFVEMHLWWLITYRARAMVENRVSIKNRIYYYYPKKFGEMARAKLELFEVNGVKCIAKKLKGSARISYYNQVLDHIQKIK